MKRPQKRYESEQELLKLIDANHAKLHGIPGEIARCTVFADSLAKWLGEVTPETDREKAVYYKIAEFRDDFRKDAQKLELSIPRLHSKSAKFKQKLSEFRTLTMKVILGKDDSVV